MMTIVHDTDITKYSVANPTDNVLEVCCQMSLVILHGRANGFIGWGERSILGHSVPEVSDMDVHRNLFFAKVVTPGRTDQRW